MFGQRNVSNGAAAKDLFSVGILGELSDVVPTKTIELVNSLLRSEGVVDNQFVIRDRTVKEIVSELTNCKGFLAWDSETPSMDAAEKIANILTKVGSEAGNVQKSTIIPVPVVHSVGSGTATSTSAPNPSPNPTPSVSDGTLTAVQMAETMKRELGYDKDLAINDLIERVSHDILDESESVELMKIKKVKEKLQLVTSKSVATLQTADIIKRELEYDKNLAVKNLIEAVSRDFLKENEIEELGQLKRLIEKLQFIADKTGVSL
jgi:hypothetical protein